MTRHYCDKCEAEIKAGGAAGIHLVRKMFNTETGWRDVSFQLTVLSTDSDRCRRVVELCKACILEVLKEWLA